MDMKQVATELLEVLRQGLVSGSKLVSEQFPILCQQIIRWGIVNNICTILLSIFMIIGSLSLACFAIKKQKSTENEYDAPLWLFLSIPSVLIAIIFLILFWCSVFEIGKILSAPNVYLLDYFKSLLTPNK